MSTHNMFLWGNEEISAVWSYVEDACSVELTINFLSVSVGDIYSCVQEIDRKRCDF